MRWLNFEQLGSNEEPMAIEDECIDRLQAEDNEVMDLRVSSNTPIHTLLVKRDDVNQQAKELRPSELSILANKVTRDRFLDKPGKDIALDFLDAHRELWDLPDETDIEESTPNAAWDKVRWNKRAFKVFLWGLDENPITLWSLNKAERKKAAKHYKLSSYHRTLLWILSWAFWGCIEDGDTPEETWFVQTFEVEQSAKLWGTMSFKNVIHTDALKSMAVAIDNIGSRFKLKTMLDQYNDRLKAYETAIKAAIKAAKRQKEVVQLRSKLLTHQQRKVIGKDIKGLWDMWKYHKYLEDHTYTPTMVGRW